MNIASAGGEAGQAAQHPSEVLSCPCALSEHDRHILQYRIFADVNPLLRQICNGTCKPSSLVGIVENVTTGDGFRIKGSDAQYIVQLSVKSMILDSIKCGLDGGYATACIPRQAAKLADDFVMDRHDEIEIQQLSGP